MRPRIPTVLVVLCASLVLGAGCGDGDADTFSEDLGLALAPLLETHGAQDIASGAVEYTEKRGREILERDIESEREVVRRLEALDVPEDARDAVLSMEFAFEEAIERTREAMADGLTRDEYREHICCPPDDLNEALRELERLGFLDPAENPARPS